MKKFYALLCSAALLLSGCMANELTQQETAQNTKAFRVVTTISPLYSFTSHLIAGTDNVELSNIVPPNTSVHSFSLTPQVAKTMNEADLIIINGLELEEFLEEILEDSKDKIVDTSKDVALRKSITLVEPGKDEHHDEDEHEDEHHDEEEHHEEEEHEEEEGHHHHGEYDPHIWLSPKNAKMQAKNIVTALIALDADNTDLYNKNLSELDAKLDELSTKIQTELSQLDIKPYIVFHDAYQYFEKDFNIHSTAYLEEFPGKEPSASYLAKIIDIITDNKVEVIFSEPQFAPKLVQTLASDYNIKVGELDPLGTEISKDAYFKMMRKNVEAFKSAFDTK